MLKLRKSKMDFSSFIDMDRGKSKLVSAEELLDIIDNESRHIANINFIPCKLNVPSGDFGKFRVTWKHPRFSMKAHNE